MAGFDFLCSILAAPPTAELEPLTDGQVSQTDEVRRENIPKNLNQLALKRLFRQLTYLDTFTPKMRILIDNIHNLGRKQYFSHIFCTEAIGLRMAYIMTL